MKKILLTPFVALVFLFVLTSAFMVGAEVVDGQTYICQSRSIGHKHSNNETTAGIMSSLAPWQVAMLTDDNTDNIHLFNFTGSLGIQTIVYNVSTRDSAKALEGIVGNWSAINDSFAEVYVVDNGQSQKIMRLQWNTTQRLPDTASPINASSTLNYSAFPPSTSVRGMGSNDSYPGSKDFRTIFIVNTTNANSIGIYAYDLAAQQRVGNCSISNVSNSSYVGINDVVNIFVVINTSDIYVVNKTVGAYKFRMNKGASCTPVPSENIYWEYKSRNSKQLTFLQNEVNGAPYTFINPSIAPANGSLYLSGDSFGGSFYFFLNGTGKPGVMTFNPNQTTSFYNESVTFQVTVNTTECINMSVQLGSNVSGDRYFLNESIDLAVSKAVTTASPGNYTDYNRTIMMNMTDWCNKPVGFYFTACTGAGACANTSIITTYAAPFFNVTNGSLPDSFVSRCFDVGKGLEVTTKSGSGRASGLLLLRPYFDLGNATAPYMVNNSQGWTLSYRNESPAIVKLLVSNWGFSTSNVSTAAVNGQLIVDTSFPVAGAILTAVAITAGIAYLIKRRSE